MTNVRQTQKSRILDLLIERGGAGVFIWELMMPIEKGGCSAAQYGARILELRRMGHDIRNDRPGHFILYRQPTQLNVYSFI